MGEPRDHKTTMSVAVTKAFRELGLDADTLTVREFLQTRYPDLRHVKPSEIAHVKRRILERGACRFSAEQLRAAKQATTCFTSAADLVEAWGVVRELNG